MGLIGDALAVLADSDAIEVRIERGFYLRLEDVQEALDDFNHRCQFVFLEGKLSESAKEWLKENQWAVKVADGVIAIAKTERNLPDIDFMYALWAGYLNLPIETWAIIHKKDD